MAWNADVNLQDLEGMSPLHVAVLSAIKTRDISIIKKLIMKGADRNIKDNKGRTSLELA